MLSSLHIGMTIYRNKFYTGECSNLSRQFLALDHGLVYGEGNNMDQIESSGLNNLENRELAGVTFIRNYLQLLFDGPIMNVLLWPIVTTNDGISMVDNPGYRDALCNQIGKLVTHAIEEPNKKITLQFSDGSKIEISLKERGQTGPEAINLVLENGEWQVW